MKKIMFILATLSLLMSGCNNEYDEVLDESVLSELASFEYLGYIYYIHPRLAIYQSDVKYKDVEKAVQSLDSYGYQSWFIPSMNELEQAAKKGYLPIMFDTVRVLFYISSSQSNGTYQCLVYLQEYGWNPVNIGNYSGYSTVRPMIKFRKRKQ
ncbi:hypothetical protein [Ileibacterium valens]|uniref:hypothetical protein n=1 Tax=Ileibacterium valens TaxID=1862668 RepID=UPI0032209DEE